MMNTVINIALMLIVVAGGAAATIFFIRGIKNEK